MQESSSTVVEPFTKTEKGGLLFIEIGQLKNWAAVWKKKQYPAICYSHLTYTLTLSH